MVCGMRHGGGWAGYWGDLRVFYTDCVGVVGVSMFVSWGAFVPFYM